MKQIMKFSEDDYEIQFDRDTRQYLITEKYGSREEWINDLRQCYLDNKDYYDTTFQRIGRYLYCLDNTGCVGKCVVGSGDTAPIHYAVAYADLIHYPIYHG